MKANEVRLQTDTILKWTECTRRQTVSSDLQGQENDFDVIKHCTINEVEILNVKVKLDHVPSLYQTCIGNSTQ